MIIHYLASPTCAFCRQVAAMITPIAQQTGTEFRHYEEIGLMPEPARSAVIAKSDPRLPIIVLEHPAGAFRVYGRDPDGKLNLIALRDILTASTQPPKP